MSVLVVLAVLESTLLSFCVCYKIQCQETTVTAVLVSAVAAVVAVSAKTRVLKTGHARVETRVLKTLARRNAFWTSFKQ